MELSQTSYVLLGTLSFGPRTGYSIKTLLDKSARFFWATSYSQIYPELKKLAELGLVEGRDTTEGGRKRVEYRITEAGTEALQTWLVEPPEIFELRDEGLLKLFFTNGGRPEDALRTLAAMRERHRAVAAQLQELAEGAAQLQPGNPYPDIVRRAGVAFFDLFAQWCSKTEQELLESMGGDEKPPGEADTGDRTEPPSASTAGAGTTPPRTTETPERNPDV